MVASSIIFLITISHTAVANKALPSRERGVFQPPPQAICWLCRYVKVSFSPFTLKKTFGVGCYTMKNLISKFY